MPISLRMSQLLDAYAEAINSEASAGEYGTKAEVKMANEEVGMARAALEQAISKLEIAEIKSTIVDYHPVFAEVHSAYVVQQNHGFRASQAVTPQEAAAIMELCCPAYNNFRPELLLFLPNDCQVTLAREGSVCIYVKSKKQLSKKLAALMEADEFERLPQDTYNTANYQPDARFDRLTPYGGYKGEYRIWWD